MKLFLALLALFAVAVPCDARLHPSWSYEKMTEGAGLIVVATPTETNDTAKTFFPGLDVPAVGIETEFKVLAVLKGDKKLKDFVLYHLREDSQGPVDNGPQTVSFDPKRQRRYLLFLKREADGRCVSVTGQVDPVDGIKDLGAYP